MLDSGAVCYREDVHQPRDFPTLYGDSFLSSLRGALDVVLFIVMWRASVRKDVEDPEENRKLDN